jgi:CDP-diglyceride synthetase
MKHFLLGIGVFSLIAVAIIGAAELLALTSLSKDQIGNVLLLIALLFVVKPFGEITASLFKLNIK